MDLEKQLAENKHKLEELKDKGKSIEMVQPRVGEDVQSELTIYQNEVQCRRERSSSEDDVMMSSDDQLDSFDSVEHEISRQSNSP